jgi:small-conductance mechanosensitive channel
MNFNDFIQQVLFNIGDHDVTARQLISWGIILIVTFLIYQLVINKVLPKYFAQEKYVIRDNSRILKSIRNIFVLIAMIGTVWVLEVDLLLYQMKNVGVRVSTVLYALTIWQVAGLLDWFASKVLVYNYHRSRNDLDYQTSVEKYAKETNSNAGNLVRLLVYAAAVFLVLQSFNLESYTVINSTNPIKVSDILEAVLIILAARLVFWMVTQLFLYRYYKRSKIDTGSQYAINQLLKYVIYTMAILWAISSLGIKVTVLWGGAAALLVGIGLGLQQTFNDFFSGIVLLFERSVEIGQYWWDDWNSSKNWLKNFFN